MDFNSSDIFEMSYVSKSNYHLSQQQLLRLIGGSREWNERHEITSILFYGNNAFCQILEGPLRSLDLVCRRIRTSSLHFKIQHLETRLIQQRSIPNHPLRFFAEEALMRQYPVLALEMTRAELHRINLTRAAREAAIEASGVLINIQHEENMDKLNEVV